MNSKQIFLVSSILTLLGIAFVTFSYGQTALADRGGDPNNSDKAQANADERGDKKFDRALERTLSDNPGEGPLIAHLNIEDGKGVGCTSC